MKTSGTAPSKREVWRDVILQQEKSGLSVRAFCQQRGISDQSFYYWRKQLAMNLPVRFALVETQEASQQGRGGVELWLNGGDRLHIATGVDVATLRTVVAVLRECR